MASRFWNWTAVMRGVRPSRSWRSTVRVTPSGAVPCMSARRTPEPSSQSVERMAMCRAVRLCHVSCAAQSAASCAANSSISWRCRTEEEARSDLEDTARCSTVRPCLSASPIGTPCATSRRSASIRPSPAARVSGVHAMSGCGARSASSGSECSSISKLLPSPGFCHARPASQNSGAARLPFRGGGVAWSGECQPVTSAVKSRPVASTSWPSCLVLASLPSAQASRCFRA
mmetsp:Transcript_46086/g.117716  ORF Transcript_46086/g.117716 Transcript_46086/m.117716 type:complete len:230 (+) Transcript_46086:961-1650(+)